MALLKNDAIIKDSWTQLDDDADIAGTAKPIVNLARWMRDRETLLGHNGEIGIVLASDEPPPVWRHLSRFSKIHRRARLFLRKAVTVALQLHR